MHSYNPIVTRRRHSAGLLCAFVAFTGLLIFGAEVNGAQQSPKTPPPAAAPEQQAPPSSTDEPPEEDDSVKPKIYPFNPLEAERNIRVGNFYMHKSDYRGALSRYEEASKYNPSSAEAYLRIGFAEEKLKHRDRAKAAFQKVVQLEPDTKTGKEAKKKLSSLG
jgi:tetratricopeptide (TPR) repeat protein